VNKSEILELEIAKNKRRLQKNYRIIRKGKRFQKQYGDTLTRFKQKQSDEEIMSGILSEIESTARTLDMRISDMKPQRVKKQEYYNIFSVNLAINGQLDEILHFLYLLQNPPHLFNIDELRIEKSSPRAKSLHSRMVFSRILIP
jgi:Tfp pilus assembly protein PilO